MSNGEEKISPQRFTILGLGDSITEGGEAFSSYLFPLWEKLFAGGYLTDFVGPKQHQCRIGELNHAGYSGKTVEYLESIVDTVYQKYPADIVLIHTGHNHFVEENPVTGMIVTYQSIIHKIKKINPDVIILLAQVIPSGKLPKYAYIPELNKEIVRMVSALKDPKVKMVDQATGFDWKRYTVEDLVHPNRQGAERMATVWYENLSQILPQPKFSFHPEIIPYRIIGQDTLKMHIFKPTDWKPTDRRPVLTYFFGGGWKLGTPLQFYRECAYYAFRGIVAITVDYRIAFLHQTTPDDSLDDARDAICWLRAHAEELGIDPDHIAASGASAGGYLVAAMGLEQDAEAKCYRPDLLILNYAPLDKFKSIGKNIPPVLFLVGSEDPLVSLSSVEELGKKIREQKGSFDLHVFEGAGHPIFYYRKDLDEKFYRVRELTDRFLTQYEYLKE